MHECIGGIASTATSITHKIFIGVMGAADIVAIGLSIYAIAPSDVTLNSLYNRIAYHGFGAIFGLVHNCLGIIGALVAVLSFTRAIGRAPQLRNAKFRTLAYLLPLSLLGHFATRLTLVFVRQSIEIYIVTHFFIIMTITVALYLVPNAGLAAGNIPSLPLYTTICASGSECPPESEDMNTNGGGYNVPPLPQMSRLQELPGHAQQPPVHPQRPLAPLAPPQQPPSPGPHSQTVELPQQPYRN
ncbi:uncharacterized protein GIQ15_06914 [Arthroderma uncinatum]|uniref:uncharacterized protein n=1 Tax=Arthroderma uncinatum TaxID=74035 RepID=UPI00144A7463|nr:uncharacterized protein GIQ15_06914 [Arthroderma uncinatum]KAF3479938.1 hypothetical protein GIQ15_06914 [Arthroderma uncinatum]